MTKNGFFCWKIIRSNCPIGHTDTNIDFASKNDSEKHIFSNLVEEIRKNGFGYFLKVFLCLLVLDRSLDKWWSYWCYCYWHQLMKGSVWKRFWNMSSRLFCAINAKPSCQWWLPPPRYTDFFNLRLVANGKKIHTTFTDRGYLDVATAVHLLLTYPILT